LTLTKCECLPAFGKRGKCNDVVSAREVWTVTNEDRCPQRGVVIEIVLGLGQSVKCIWVDTVEYLGSIYAYEDNLSSPLDGHLGIGG
jgi:hypothetical protein